MDKLRLKKNVSEEKEPEKEPEEVQKPVHWRDKKDEDLTGEEIWLKLKNRNKIYIKDSEMSRKFREFLELRAAQGKTDNDPL